MFISRFRFEKELDKAYNKGYDEAMERSGRDMGFERVWGKLHELDEKIHCLQLRQGSADNEACVKRSF